jgi:3-hydroxy-5-phosphonooxypentane-2,4-dione thiolase
LPELDALTMAYRAVQEGAAGVDMGRNIFQSDCPTGMIQAVSKIVPDGMTPAEAFDLYTMIKRTQAETEPQPMT